MARPMGLLQWSQTVSIYLPHLSQPHRTGLALWSCGIVLAQSCGLTTVAACLASLLGKGEATVREQLRDWYRDGAHKSGAKRGHKRRRLEGSACFAPWLRWVVAWSDPPCRHLALAMDASPWGQRFPVLSSVWSFAGVRAPSPGALSRRHALGPGARIGKRSLAICRAVFQPTGPSLSWPIVASTPIGSSLRFRRWAGIPSSGSIGKGTIVRRPARPFAP